MNQPLPRRVFLMTLAASGAALATGAQAQALLDGQDAQAVALGYVAGATRRRQEVSEVRCRPELHQLGALPGQAGRQSRRLPAVRCQAAGGRRLVQRLGEEGMNAGAGRGGMR